MKTLENSQIFTCELLSQGSISPAFDAYVYSEEEH